MAKEKVDMECGKIYFISYGGTELIARYKDGDSMRHNFFAHLHYWNGYERFHAGGYGVTHGIEEIRRATPSERHNLLRNEIANDTI